MSDDAPNWRALITPQFLITAAMLALAWYATILVLTGDFSVELKAAVVTAVIISNLADHRKYWLNSTSESEKKNETINKLVTGTGSGANGNGGAVSVNIEAHEPAKK